MFLCKGWKKFQPFAYLETGEGPPQKLRWSKQRIGIRKTKFEKLEGGQLKKYEKDLQEKTTAGGFFLLPNEIFTLGLSAGEIAVYAYLLFCEDRETHLCYPSFRKIGQCTGMTPNTVRKYITQLEDKYLIETLPTTVWTLNGTARNGTLLYTILPIQEAVNYHLERQLQDCHGRNIPGKSGEIQTRPCAAIYGRLESGVL